MPWWEAEQRGMTIALGSDIGAGRSFSMRRAMASAYDNALCLGRPVTLEQLLAWATLGGARALGLGSWIGSLEKGKEADVVVVPMSGRAQSQAEVLAELVFDCDDVQVEACYVRGRSLLD